MQFLSGTSHVSSAHQPCVARGCRIGRHRYGAFPCPESSPGLLCLRRCSSGSLQRAGGVQSTCPCHLGLQENLTLKQYDKINFWSYYLLPPPPSFSSAHSSRLCAPRLSQGWSRPFLTFVPVSMANRVCRKRET